MNQGRKQAEMAKIKKKNTLLENLSGSVGDLVFRQMPDGSTRVSRKPDFSEREFSQAQTDHQGRFKLASAYASQAKTWPVYVERARRKLNWEYATDAQGTVEASAWDLAGNVTVAVL